MARKTDEQRLQELQETRAKLAEREKGIKARLSAKKRKEDARRKVIVGAVILANAEHDEEFHDYIWTILKNRVIRDTDREFLGLPPLTEADRRRINEADAKRKAAQKLRAKKSDS
ncbi:hypothetical protein JANAI62_37820 [Jannaschia pagri]|uniref:Conjugal transfer protein TraD n=1 Tax=Jannaschia pagri TaxID=2829797 RepID=A0ABQ4NRW1_9RHOB|nr:MULTISPECIES: hypothetical protein [unclassified Jannaschia]GIT93356.1 hypothetical protein JANAI61_38140 [Jannaschia sp. AI_61]GIT97159.1 hypothetical protein JANAI62_37820 [Jannaschia sp. AI_62]